MLYIEVGEFFAEHELDSETGHRDTAYLGDQRNGPRSAGVCFKNINGIICYSILNVHEAYYVKLYCNFSGVFTDGVNMFLGYANRWKDTGRVAGVYAGQLDVFHNRRDKGIGAIGNSVGLSFYGVFQKLVNQDGPFRRYLYSRGDIVSEHIFIVDYFHSTSAEDIGRSYH